jgi:hypothetical protein
MQILSNFYLNKFDTIKSEFIVHLTSRDIIFIILYELRFFSMILISINWVVFMFHTRNKFVIFICFLIIIVNPSYNIKLFLQVFILVIIFESNTPVMVEI